MPRDNFASRAHGTQSTVTALFRVICSKFRTKVVLGTLFLLCAIRFSSCTTEMSFRVEILYTHNFKKGKIGTGFSLRGKRFFEVTVFELVGFAHSNIN